MLKIKEGVSLEILSDYGFVESENILIWRNTKTSKKKQ